MSNSSNISGSGAKVGIPYNVNPKTTDANPENYSQKRGRPLLFQVVAPKTNEPIYNVLLALHVNPETLEEHQAHSKTVTPTVGGWVEFRWPDELTTLNASNTTGAFISPDTGLIAGSAGGSNSGSTGRKGTIAWERQEDLLDLFRNNGMVYDGNGLPAIRGRVMMIYDRGIYLGFFTTFEVDEDDSHAWSFHLSWEFHVEKALYRFPTTFSSTTTTPSQPLFPPNVTSTNTPNTEPGF